MRCIILRFGSVGMAGVVSGLGVDSGLVIGSDFVFGSVSGIVSGFELGSDFGIGSGFGGGTGVAGEGGEGERSGIVGGRKVGAGVGLLMMGLGASEYLESFLRRRVGEALRGTGAGMGDMPEASRVFENSARAERESIRRKGRAREGVSCRGVLGRL